MNDLCPRKGYRREISVRNPNSGWFFLKRKDAFGCIFILNNIVDVLSTNKYHSERLMCKNELLWKNFN